MSLGVGEPIGDGGEEARAGLLDEEEVAGVGYQDERLVGGFEIGEEAGDALKVVGSVPRAVDDKSGRDDLFRVGRRGDAPTIT